MYEKRNEPPVSRKKFYRRLLKHFGVSSLVVLVSVGLGLLGFIIFEGYSPAHAFLHASILLSGLGLVETPQTNIGKLFVSLYGLYAGLVFLIAAGIVVAPLIHRLLHKFNYAEDEED
ncbi:hypothetical protein [Sinomicrobium weinanense]|uniref:Potassium channel domain-containing protein n=1 Tax=Sinomicrobium weinanense TaxID=2842200 RepID=A0A926Q2X2_9FLAO|nr:hypothetical protein [Sinomicrobium weinanense]MBC9796973.1 hypothetical protein [Sinomicrobium weinanense]MBU3122188.1 superinfection exclusion B family protein [Sinomicrobium weinanense]